MTRLTNIRFLLLLAIINFTFPVASHTQNFTISKSVVDYTIPIQSGVDFQYKIIINYKGPLAAGELVITDVLPAGLHHINTSAPPQWNKTYSPGNKTVTITNNVAIPSNFVGAAEFIITVTTRDGEVGNGCQFCNLAELDFPPSNTITSNSVCVTIEAQNKWTIDKEVDYYLGANIIRYKVTVKPNSYFGNFDLINFSFFDESEPGSSISYVAGNIPGGLTPQTGLPSHQIQLDGNATLHVEGSSYYYFYIDVTYPCSLFAIDDMVCNNIKLLGDGPKKCPPMSDQITLTPQWDDYDFDESREKIELFSDPACAKILVPTGSANLSKTNLNKNHIPGCENIYTIIYRNVGNTPINNIEIIDDIPGEIKIINIETESFGSMSFNREYKNYNQNIWNNTNPNYKYCFQDKMDNH